MRIAMFAVATILAGPALAHPAAQAPAAHSVAADSMAAHSMSLTSALNGASEVPPNATTGAGTARARYDQGAKTLTWTVEYGGLTGPATAGHIHGPAAPGANAGVMIPFTQLASPIRGSAQLTDDQAAALMAGKLYVNIHTAAHPAGEIRGQLATAP